MKVKKQLVGQIGLGLALVVIAATLLSRWYVGDSILTTAAFTTMAFFIGSGCLHLSRLQKSQPRPIPVRADLPAIPPGQRSAYHPPAVIYEGDITTRAGSPTGLDPNGIDPADLFDH